jgi:hypothetical protein
LWKQQKYISSLERRVANLDKLEGKADHFRFEREVKLQASAKKGKNFSLKTPQNPGDRVEDDAL